MAHGKMDRSKQKRESWDVTYGLHTVSIREGPKRCLCQGNGCTLNPASPPWERVSETSEVSICSQGKMQQHCCNQVYTKFPVAPYGRRDIFDPEAGFTRPPTPAPDSESCKKPPWLRIRMGDAASLLPGAALGHCCCSARPGSRAGLWDLHGLAATGQRATLGTSGRAMPSCKSRLALLGMLWNGEEKSLQHPPPKHPPVSKPKSAPVSLELGFCFRKAASSPKIWFSCAKFLSLPPHVLS